MPSCHPLLRRKTWYLLLAGSLALATFAYAASRPAMPSRPTAPQRTLLAAASDHSGGPAVPTPTPRPTPVALPQGLGGIFFSFDSGHTWTPFDREHPVAVAHQGEPVGLHVVKKHPRLPWPRNPFRPVWDNAGRTHWGETIYVAFKDITAPHTANIVTAECGNTLTARIAVIPFHEIAISPSKTRARIVAPDSGSVTATQVIATAHVKDYNGASCAGVKVHFTAQFTDGTSPGNWIGLDQEGNAVTDTNGDANATLGGVTREGDVIMEATCIDADGKQYSHSKSPPIHFIARHRENEDPAPPQLPDPEKHAR